jgi:hypothetical protein
MLSTTLANAVVAIAKAELDVEYCRKDLCNDVYFNPYYAFERISNTKSSISFHDLYAYLRYCQSLATNQLSSLTMTSSTSSNSMNPPPLLGSPTLISSK